MSLLGNYGKIGRKLVGCVSGLIESIIKQSAFLSVGLSPQVAPAEGFSDLAMQVMTSPSKNYILTIIGAGVALLFLVGMFCGRFTKRVTQELKDR